MTQAVAILATARLQVNEPRRRCCESGDRRPEIRVLYTIRHLGPGVVVECPALVMTLKTSAISVKFLVPATFRL